MLFTLAFCSSAEQNYGFESCIEVPHWQPKKQFFLLELSNNLPWDVHSAEPLNQQGIL